MMMTGRRIRSRFMVRLIYIAIHRAGESLCCCSSCYQSIEMVGAYADVLLFLRVVEENTLNLDWCIKGRNLLVSRFFFNVCTLNVCIEKDNWLWITNVSSVGDLVLQFNLPLQKIGFQVSWDNASPRLVWLPLPRWIEQAGTSWAGWNKIRRGKNRLARWVRKCKFDRRHVNGSAASKLSPRNMKSKWDGSSWEDLGNGGWACRIIGVDELGAVIK